MRDPRERLRDVLEAIASIQRYPPRGPAIERLLQGLEESA